MSCDYRRHRLIKRLAQEYGIDEEQLAQAFEAALRQRGNHGISLYEQQEAVSRVQALCRRYGIENPIHGDTQSVAHRIAWAKVFRTFIDYYNAEGENMAGYDRRLFHRETGRHFITKQFVDPYGFTSDGIHVITRNEYDPRGFDADGNNRWTHEPYDHYGFDRLGIHRETGTIYDPRGFDACHYHRNGTPYDEEGRDYLGFSSDGKYYAPDGTPQWLTPEGIAPNGFTLDPDRNQSVHYLTRQPYDPYGFDIEGRYIGFDNSTAEANKLRGLTHDPAGYNAKHVNRQNVTRTGRQLPVDDVTVVQRLIEAWEKVMNRSVLEAPWLASVYGYTASAIAGKPVSVQLENIAGGSESDESPLAFYQFDTQTVTINIESFSALP